jgi:hypothetical protein
VTSGPRVGATLRQILDELDVAPERAILGGGASPEQLRQERRRHRADLQELLGPT